MKKVVSRKTTIKNTAKTAKKPATKANPKTVKTPVKKTPVKKEALSKTVKKTPITPEKSVPAAPAPNLGLPEGSVTQQNGQRRPLIVFPK
jgi:hypothetical protein